MSAKTKNQQTETLARTTTTVGYQSFNKLPDAVKTVLRDVITDSRDGDIRVFAKDFIANVADELDGTIQVSKSNPTNEEGTRANLALSFEYNGTQMKFPFTAPASKNKPSLAKAIIINSKSYQLGKTYINREETLDGEWKLTHEGTIYDTADELIEDLGDALTIRDTFYLMNASSNKGDMVDRFTFNADDYEDM